MSPLTLVPRPSPDTGSATRTRSAAAADRQILDPASHALLVEAYADRMGLAPESDDLESHLQGVLADTLAHPGSLLRGQLAFDIQRRAGIAQVPAADLAVAIEYFHSASLLFDDLPAMDDGTQRRGRRCPHLIFGEAATQLAALALITRAYALLWRSISRLPARRSRQAAELVDECLGVHGILDGQSRDLHSSGSWTARDVERVAQGKTVTLIRLSLVLPALVARTGEEEIHELERLARAWGLAYQIVDDFKDHLHTAQESGKTPHRDRAFDRPNLPAVAGSGFAMMRLRGLLAEAEASIARLVDQDRGKEGDHEHDAKSRHWNLLPAVHGILAADARDVSERLRLTHCA